MRNVERWRRIVQAALLCASIGWTAGCSDRPNPHWKLIVENETAKPTTVTVDYTLEGGDAPGKHALTDEVGAKKTLDIGSGEGKIVVHSASFTLGKFTIRAKGDVTAGPRQLVIIKLDADEKATMRVE